MPMIYYNGGVTIHERENTMIALERLQFSDANAKLAELYNVPELETWLADGRKVYSLDLLSGYS